MISLQTLALTCVILLCAVEASRPKWHQLTAAYSFQQYLADFHKFYPNPEEYKHRQSLFESALVDVMTHNRGGFTWKKGINHLSDVTPSEFELMRQTKVAPPDFVGAHQKAFDASKIAAAVSIDYRTTVPHVLTAVKDQGFCGNCWAHAVTESVESAYAIASGELYALSQQQVTSCTPLTGSCYSCNGSFPQLGFEYVTVAGLTEEWIYSFDAYNGSFPVCRKNPTANPGYPLQTYVNISGYFSVGTNSQRDAEAALTDLGPLSISVDASGWSSYESGVFSGCSYAKNISIDHAVNVVGYGIDKALGVDYWIVRNSWSPAWGELGYIRLVKQPQAQCGWNVGAGYTVDCYNAGPNQVWACGECGILFNPIFPIVLK